MINDPGYAYHGKFAPIDKKTRLGEYLDEVKGNVDTFDFSFEKNFGENWLLKGNYAWSRANYDYFQARVININLRNSAMNGGRLPVGYASRRAEYLKDVDYYTHAGSLNLNGIVETLQKRCEATLIFGERAEIPQTICKPTSTFIIPFTASYPYLPTLIRTTSAS